MKNIVSVCPDSFLTNLLERENVSQRDEVRLSICQFLKQLGLVTLDVKVSSVVPEALVFNYTYTDQLAYLVKDEDEDEDEDVEDEDDDES